MGQAFLFLTIAFWNVDVHVHVPSGQTPIGSDDKWIMHVSYPAITSYWDLIKKIAQHLPKSGIIRVVPLRNTNNTAKLNRKKVIFTSCLPQSKKTCTIEQG